MGGTRLHLDVRPRVEGRHAAGANALRGGADDVVRALQWLAGRDVTLPVPADFPTAERVSVRPEAPRPGIRRYARRHIRDVGHLRQVAARSNRDG